MREAALRLIRAVCARCAACRVHPAVQDGWSASFCGRTVWAGGDCKPLPSFVPERRFAGVEAARFSLLGRDVRVARVRGAAQMERLLGSFGPHALPWQVIEVLVCAGGCDRG